MEPILSVGRNAEGKTCWVVESPGGGERKEFYCGHPAMEYLRSLRETLGLEPTEC